MACDVIMKDGFIWTLIGEQPFITKRLRVPTTLLVWRGYCVTCSEPFEITTRQRTESDGNMDLRNCKAHRLSPSGWRVKRHSNA